MISPSRLTIILSRYLTRSVCFRRLKSIDLIPLEELLGSLDERKPVLSMIFSDLSLTTTPSYLVKIPVTINLCTIRLFPGLQRGRKYISYDFTSVRSGRIHSGNPTIIFEAVLLVPYMARKKLFSPSFGSTKDL